MFTHKKNNNNQTWYNYIDSSQSKHLLIVCCNRDQTSDIHGTFTAFYGQLTEYRSLYASTYYNVYRSITHAPGLSQSISLDSLLVTHLGYVQRNHVLIDIFTHWCGWRLIFRQEKDWVFFVLVYSSCLHPPTHHN